MTCVALVHFLMCQTVGRTVTSTAPQPVDRHLRFGNVAVICFLIVQGLDGSLTYMGVSTWGLAVEGNPLRDIDVVIGKVPWVMITGTVFR